MKVALSWLFIFFGYWRKQLEKLYFLVISGCITQYSSLLHQKSIVTVLSSVNFHISTRDTLLAFEFKNKTSVRSESSCNSSHHHPHNSPNFYIHTYIMQYGAALYSFFRCCVLAIASSPIDLISFFFGPVSITFSRKNCTWRPSAQIIYYVLYKCCV